MPKKLTDCVKDVKAQGKSDDSAWAICIDSTGEKPHSESIKEDTTPCKKKNLRRELEREGIQEPELTRAVEAEFDYPTPEFEPFPGPITGLDLAGDIDDDLIFASKSPPFVLPQEKYAGPFHTSDTNPYPNNPTPDDNSKGSTSYTYDFINSSAEPSTNWLGLASDINSETPTAGVEGYNSSQAIPPWRYDVEDSQMYPDEPIDIIIPPSGALNEALTDDKKKQKKSLLRKLLPWIGIVGSVFALEQIVNQFMDKAPKEFDNAKDEEKYFTHNIPTMHARMMLSPSHTGRDVCDDYAGEIFDLVETSNRPILPSEGLGYTNLVHPNCHCRWRLEKVDTLLDSLSRKQQTKFDDISTHIRKAAKDHTLHTVKADGALSNRTRGTNPMRETMSETIQETIQETIGTVFNEFEWLSEEYLDNAKKLAEDVGGRLYLVRAANETLTDHRSEGEQYRRKISGAELNGMARTAIGKKMDINHDSTYETDAMVLDSEYDSTRKEIQMIILEKDNEINQAIQENKITAVSINGGSPRSESIEPCHDNCVGDSCEMCNVPKGVILAEEDDIALTWVVTNPDGIFWRGSHIPFAEPGIKTTVIEII